MAWKGQDPMKVRAVDRAVDILLEFIDRPKMSAVEIQKRLKLPKPTVYRLLAGLQERGLVYSDGDPRQYRLGTSVLMLSRAWSRSFDLAAESEPRLIALSERTGETAALFLRHGAQERILVRHVRSPSPLNYSLDVGAVSPLIVGAAGKAILAFLPEQEAKAI